MTPELSKKMFRVYHSLDALIKDKQNPFYKSNYADINSVLKFLKPILKKEGLYTMQPIINNQLLTFIVDSETGEIFPKYKPDDLENSKGLNIVSLKPQERGSEITFYRRFALISFFGLEAEDDDANVTVKRQINKPINNPNTDTFTL